MKRILAAAFAVSMALPAPARAQMAVIDNANLAKAIETAKNTLSQLEEAKRLTNTLNQVTDLGSAASILNNPMIQSGLPGGVTDTAKLLSKDFNELGELGARAKDIYSGMDGSVDGALSSGNSLLDLAAKAAARDQAVAENGMTVTKARSDGLAALAQQLSGAATAKESMDIQARASIEAASAANQTNQMLALEYARQAQERADSVAYRARQQSADKKYLDGLQAWQGDKK